MSVFANEILLSRLKILPWTLHTAFRDEGEINRGSLDQFCCISLHWLLYVSHCKYVIELQCYRLKSEWRLILLCFDIFALFNVHAYWFFVIVETEVKFVMSTTGSPRLLQECGGYSFLLAVLCYKRLFTKGCMGCEWFFKKRKKMFCVF